MTQRILEAWNEYRRCIPDDAPPIQIQETRRAFYAGAGSLFSTILDMLDPGTEATQDDLRKMDELATELREWVDDVRAGRA